MGNYPGPVVGTGEGSCIAYYMPSVAGTRTITATHSGGPVAMGDPAPTTVAATFGSPPSGDYSWAATPPTSALHAFTLPAITPTYPRATGYSMTTVSPPPGYQGSVSTRTAPVGTGQFILICLTGGVALDAPLVVTLSDGAGGVFPGGPVTLVGNDIEHGSAVACYVPMTAGLRTITATSTGGNAGMAQDFVGLPLLAQFLAT